MELNWGYKKVSRRRSKGSVKRQDKRFSISSNFWVSSIIFSLTCGKRAMKIGKGVKANVQLLVCIKYFYVRLNFAKVIEVEIKIFSNFWYEEFKLKFTERFCFKSLIEFMLVIHKITLVLNTIESFINLLQCNFF